MPAYFEMSLQFLRKNLCPGFSPTSTPIWSGPAWFF